MKNYWKAFGSLFFLLHQGKLLWLLNAPVVGRWFRWVLRISGESSSVGDRHIFRILPNAVFWWDGPNQKAEFRTHAKFSKRLYYAFAPLWWAMHAWDWALADRWVPELSFGFSVLTAYPDAGSPGTTTVDGSVKASLASGGTWAAIVADAGGAADDISANDSCVWFRCYTSSNLWDRLLRGIFLFDTSSLTSPANISAATMSLWGTSKTDGPTATPNIDVYTSAPVSNTSLAAGDFDSLGSVSQTGSPITYASFSTTGYNNFAFNATGIGNISKTGVSKYGTRNANYDVAGSAPPWSSAAICDFVIYYADQTGTANDPKLVVTYTLIGQVIMISQKPMGLKDIALMTVVGLVIKNPSISRKKLLRWWHEDN